MVGPRVPHPVGLNRIVPFFHSPRLASCRRTDKISGLLICYTAHALNKESAEVVISFILVTCRLFNRVTGTEMDNFPPCRYGYQFPLS